jgi:hypothetical protein
MVGRLLGTMMTLTAVEMARSRVFRTCSNLGSESA